MSEVQNFKNHNKFVPAFHFFVVPIFLVNIVWSIEKLVHAFSEGTLVSLLVAVVERQAETKVKAGENGGKTLSHVQIVRAFEVLPLDGALSGGGHLDWPAGVAAGDGEVIAFLQDQENGKIVAATKTTLEH